MPQERKLKNDATTTTGIIQKKIKINPEEGDNIIL
jgi:hypothetical protein